MVSKEDLLIPIKKNDVDENTSLELQNFFTPILEKASEWKGKVDAIVVTSIDQKDLIKQARATRLELRQMRIKVENKRKELKEGIVKKGRAIDEIASTLKGLITPMEEHLDKQEKFAERLEKERVEKLRTTRLQELKDFDFDAQLYPLGEMDELPYQNLLKTAKTAYEKAKEDERKRKEEEEREAKEKAIKEERRQILVEGDLIRFWNNANEVDLGTVSEMDFQNIISELSKIKSEWEEEQERVRKENARLKAEAEEREAKLKEETEAREKAEEERKKKESEILSAERKKREDAEAKLKEETEAREKAEEERKAEAERKLAAPDAEKLRQLADEIEAMTCKNLQSNRAIEAYKFIKQEIENIAAKARKEANNLKTEK